MDADLILSDERIDDHGRPVPIPPTSEDQCPVCGRLTDCCGNCKCEGTTK